MKRCMLLALLAACRSPSAVQEPRPEETPPAAGRPTPSASGEGVVHGLGTVFTISASEAACGDAACGNGQRDSCTLWPRAQMRRLEWDAEACDASTHGVTCEALGYHGGTLACSDACAWDASSCTVCEPGQCRRYAMEPEVSRAWMGIAAASDGARVRLLWGVREVEHGVGRHCLYTAWAGDEAATLLSCDEQMPVPIDVELSSTPQGFDVDVRWDFRRWSARIDDDGVLREVTVEDGEALWPRPEHRDTVEFEGATLRAITSAPQQPRVPLQVQWFDAAGPVGAPQRLVSDPDAWPGLIAAAPAGEGVIVAWSSSRGAFSAFVDRPEGRR